MVFKALRIYFHNTSIILYQILKIIVMSAVNIHSLISKSVLDFALSTSTLYVLFIILYSLLLLCFAEIQATSAGAHMKTMLHHLRLQIYSANMC